jgi:gas vesicle protein
MNKQESGNNGKLLGALLIGAAIGAALGILFAPAKGDETRRKISDKARDLTDDLTGMIKETMSGNGRSEKPDEGAV